MELKKRGLIELFFLNIEKVRNAGCSFTLEVTPSDELIPYIDEVKKTSLENVGALCHLTVARNDRISSMPILTKLSREDYKKRGKYLIRSCLISNYQFLVKNGRNFVTQVIGLYVWI